MDTEQRQTAGRGRMAKTHLCVFVRRMKSKSRRLKPVEEAFYDALTAPDRCINETRLREARRPGQIIVMHVMPVAPGDMRGSRNDVDTSTVDDDDDPPCTHSCRCPPGVRRLPASCAPTTDRPAPST